jgi:hypothetical protein
MFLWLYQTFGYGLEVAATNNYQSFWESILRDAASGEGRGQGPKVYVLKEDMGINHKT